MQPGNPESRVCRAGGCGDGADTRLGACGHCQSCVFSAKLSESTQWLLSAGQAARRSFLSGLLVRCRSAEVLENLRSVLQVTSGKDFTYARSHVQAASQEELRGWCRGADAKLGVMDTWEWFSRSSNWTQSNYLLGVLSQCDTELLHMLGNLVRVLMVREKRGILQFSTARSAVWSGVTFKGLRVNESDAHSDSSEDPALMVVPRSSKSMSGVGLHRDFIRRLPVDIAKRILGLLDPATLQQCKHVSQHWRYLTEEIVRENEVKRMVENQAMVLQGSSSSGVNPVYARIRQVLVPLGEEENYIQPLMISPSNKKAVRDFESVYTEIKTKAVEMEERNVYCGVFNILVLLDREDPSRVIHYSGGQMVAVGSKDRVVHLLDATLLKEVPLLMQGHAGSVRTVLICEERDLVISGSYDLSIRCWNLKTGACTLLLWGHMGTISCLDLHADLLVSGARDCRVKVWNLQTGQCCERLRFRHRKPVVCVKISASLVLSGCEEGLVKMWEMETAALLKVVDGHRGCVKCLFFDQWHILSGGSDGQVLAWSTNPDFKKSLMTFHHPKEVLTLSFLFLRVITGCVDGKIRIFNFLSGDCLRVIKISSHQSPVLSLHAHGNNILVNSSSRVLLLRFSQERWDYSALSERRSGTAFHAALNGIVRNERKALSSSSKPKTSKRDERARARVFSHHARSHSAPSTQRTQEKLNEKYAKTPSERAAREHVKKRGDHRPMTAPEILLKVRPTQQPHNCDLAMTNMNLNAAVRDAWGPPPSGSDHQTNTAPPSPPPKRQPLTPKPYTKSCFKGTLKIYTPLRTHMADLNLQHSLHSKHIPSPTLIRPQTGLGIHDPLSYPKDKSRHPQTACGVRRVGAFTTTAEEDIQDPQKMFMRSTVKHPGRHVDFDMSRKPETVYNPLDPFRERGGFQLKTDTELEELVRGQAQLHHRPARTGKDNERQRKTAWKLNIKGVPPNEYTKEDQVYAPELGEDTYI